MLKTLLNVKAKWPVAGNIFSVRHRWHIPSNIAQMRVERGTRICKTRNENVIIVHLPLHSTIHRWLPFAHTHDYRRCERPTSTFFPHFTIALRRYHTTFSFHANQISQKLAIIATQHYNTRTFFGNKTFASHWLTNYEQHVCREFFRIITGFIQVTAVFPNRWFSLFSSELENNFSNMAEIE